MNSFFKKIDQWWSKISIIGSKLVTMRNVTKQQISPDNTKLWSIPSHLTNPTPTYETLLYHVSSPLAFITFNRPKKLNTISPLMPSELQHSITRANHDDSVKIIILRGNGTSFCAGFDFSDDLATLPSNLRNSMENWNPGVDMMLTTSKLTSPVARFMSIWYSPKPVIAQIHGYCVGGGSDMALCADIIIAADDAIIGTPYSRIWGAYLTGMWIHRLGLTKCKELALSGEALTGKKAAEINLINKSVPFNELEAEVLKTGEKLAQIPVTQLATMKLMVNQVYENQGLHTTQLLGCILDGSMRHTPEAMQFVTTATRFGVQQAVKERDSPFQDYSQAEEKHRPNINHKFSYQQGEVKSKL
ncbi:unnamed protein product [Rotaria sordida]|uniref:Enoyl-CoA hydratase n=1 Tax=Rotaria sordida TaxID=392033 RepID=A0A813X502_9BILA|nr:unnamed protein product [Rotaria sordida]